MITRFSDATSGKAPLNPAARGGGAGKLRARAGGKFRLMKLKRNVGSFDVAARVTVGCGLLIAANHGYAVAGWCGVVALASAATAFCPLWSLLGVDTGRSEKSYHCPPWPADEGE